ncbi:uncharacterized protein LOC142784940 [Rhipicephalus microplus]|uniref:uncharacterized protein LOC142784940 n=1 Tax=Rhipicephalus microplus TaxID=6941 RepID=UPI003F6CCE83
MTSNPFVFIVQLVATLLLIPAECDVLGWQAAINALQPAILLPVNVSTAHAHLSDIWTTPPSSTAVGALAGLDGGATALQAIHWSIKPDRNHPDAIGHGGITDMTSNPFVFIVQGSHGPFLYVTDPALHVTDCISSDRIAFFPFEIITRGFPHFCFIYVHFIGASDFLAYNSTLLINMTKTSIGLVRVRLAGHTCNSGDFSSKTLP